eukprot:5386020-Prymnesium_polylepis.1
MPSVEQHLRVDLVAKEEGHFHRAGVAAPARAVVRRRREGHAAPLALVHKAVEAGDAHCRRADGEEVDDGQLHVREVVVLVPHEARLRR